MSKQTNDDLILSFEIADIVTEIYLSWYDAETYCKSLGEGWRLPTTEEIQLMVYKVADLRNDSYWTSDEHDSIIAKTYNTENNYHGLAYKHNAQRIRAVKTKSDLPTIDDIKHLFDNDQQTINILKLNAASQNEQLIKLEKRIAQLEEKQNDYVIPLLQELENHISDFKNRLERAGKAAEAIGEKFKKYYGLIK